jgi:hypothetical protein
MAIYQVRTNWTGSFGATDSVMHFDQVSGTAQQAATAVMNMWQSIDNALHSSVSWALDTDVRTLNEATGALSAIATVSAASATGSGTGDYVDLLQGLIVWNTGEVVDGRLLRGRTFIPGITEASVDTTGRPTSGFASVVNTAVSTLIADVNSQPVVWHRPVYSGTGSSRVLERNGSFEASTSAALKNRFSYMSGRRLAS